MAQNFSNGIEVNASGYEEAGGRVAKVVNSQPRKVGFLNRTTPSAL